MQMSRTIAILALLPLALPLGASAQTFRTEDPVIRAIWAEGMERSRTEALAQVLLDSIGPRLTGSPGFDAAGEWLLRKYREWGIPAEKQQYGTWRGWRTGAVHVDLIAPRTQTLEAEILAWSPGTRRAIDAEVVQIPEFASPAEAAAWLPSVRGKAVLVSAPQISCREPQAFAALARPATVEAQRERQQTLAQSWNARLRALGQNPYAALENAGAVAVLASNWSGGWGVNKVFSANTSRAVSIDLSCEDNGLLHRMAGNGWAPRVRISAEAESLGTVPMFNVIGRIEGTELPGEYVMLSAHLDSWHAGTGATDNGTGTLMMLEAMRILRQTYPNPRRTILVGHWGAEEQGLIGSRAFAEDHPEIVQNLQVLFNQDNGTWRIEYIQAQGFLGLSAHLAKWIAQIPTEISSEIRLDLPGPQETGGSDHVSFICHGAPSTRLQSNYPDYRQYTWHTNRDTYDKIVFDDLKNNATLAAMLMYLASEDPERVPNTRAVLPPGPDGQPREWMRCAPARRSFEGSSR